MRTELNTILKKYWGFDSFLPLQQPAVECVLNDRDSLVVLPTGGGKSVCFQLPALIKEGMAIVVSPLISLMKDQIDALNAIGVAAASINSSMSYDEKLSVNSRICSGKLKILYVSPERLTSEDFLRYLKDLDLSYIAIDEAHCVSIWGHDFRPEYGELGGIREEFPDKPFHAFTATAADVVRRDIIEKLNLKNPQLFVGDYDRPNLLYSTKRIENRYDQICEIIDRHKNESGIIYCIRKKDVDNLHIKLKDRGYKILPYHAGMSAVERTRNQEAFIQEEVDLIAATIAFGMGIDKSNVRFVIHSGMPKSIEHYQQESGRAGRDGLTAECILLYSDADAIVWKHFAGEMEGEARESAFQKLNAMSEYCHGIECRHKALVNYFGQEYAKDNCQACDVCLENLKVFENSLETAQKILSCIVRLKQRFGVTHVVRVLQGSQDKKVLNMKHERLSTYGLLSDFTRSQIRSWIDQLISQKFIVKEEEFSTLSVTKSGWSVLRGETTPKLLEPVKKKLHERKITKAAAESWEGVDRELFDSLRDLRFTIAMDRDVPAYIIFGDLALRDMARQKPQTLEEFRDVYGVGDKKTIEFGEQFLSVIREYCKGE